MAVKSKFLQTLSDVLDVSKVVDFRTFVESEEYLGITGVFEWWYEQLNHRVDRLRRGVFSEVPQVQARVLL